MLTVTPLYGGILALLFIYLSLARIIHQTPGISFRRTGSAGLTAAF
ncbi:MAG: hypothetical protein Q9M48_00130 [Rhodobacterales bacterium]|nr:hypothetical protein [Rhodobacterales bacterium]